MEIQLIDPSILTDLLKNPDNDSVDHHLNSFNPTMCSASIYFALLDENNILGLTALSKNSSNLKNHYYLEYFYVDTDFVDYYSTYLLLKKVVSYCANESAKLRIGSNCLNSLILLNQDLELLCQEYQVKLIFK